MTGNAFDAGVTRGTGSNTMSYRPTKIFRNVSPNQGISTNPPTTTHQPPTTDHQPSYLVSSDPPKGEGGGGRGEGGGEGWQAVRRAADALLTVPLTRRMPCGKARNKKVALARAD